MADLTQTLTGVLTSMFTLSTPLLLAALGETVVQKSGVVNVGLEGILLTGAFASTLWATGHPDLLTSLVAAALAGSVMAALFALFAIRLVANQVVVGVVINLLALGLTGTLYRAKFGATGTFVQIPTLKPLLFGQNALTLFAIACVPLLAWWLYHTRKGLELRACGEQPTAAEAAGTNVQRLRGAALLFGGAMAGLAGASLSVGNVGTFVENMTSGRGFIALAIVTAGRWNAFGCLVASLVFGLMEALQSQGQALGLQLPYQLFLALPYIVTLVVLVGGSKHTQAPAALGRPYRKA